MSHPVSSICQKLILFLRFLKKEKGTEPAVKKWIAASLPQFFHIFPTCHTPILALCHTPDLAIYVTLAFLLYMSHSHSCYIYVTLAFLLYICHTPILAIYMSHSQSCYIHVTLPFLLHMSHSHSCSIYVTGARSGDARLFASLLGSEAGCTERDLGEGDGVEGIFFSRTHPFLPYVAPHVSHISPLIFFRR